MMTSIMCYVPLYATCLRVLRASSNMFTSAPTTPHLEPKPSPISNQPPIDTINLSLLPSRNTTLHSYTPALPTLDTFGEQLTLFIANLPLHSLPPFHLPLSLTHSAHFSQTKFIPSLHTTVSSSLTILHC